MTDRQAHIVRWLDRPAWLRPMDIGARDGSWHHGVLQQLIRQGLVERRRRNTLMNVVILGRDAPSQRRGGFRGSYEYRLTRNGVLARRAIIQHEADVAEGRP